MATGAVARDHDEFRDRALVLGRDEVDQLQALLGDGDVAGGDVGDAAGHVGHQVVARGRE